MHICAAAHLRVTPADLPASADPAADAANPPHCVRPGQAAGATGELPCLHLPHKPHPSSHTTPLMPPSPLSPFPSPHAAHHLPQVARTISSMQQQIQQQQRQLAQALLKKQQVPTSSHPGAPKSALDGFAGHHPTPGLTDMQTKEPQSASSSYAPYSLGEPITYSYHQYDRGKIGSPVYLQSESCDRLG